MSPEQKRARASVKKFLRAKKALKDLLTVGDYKELEESLSNAETQFLSNLGQSLVYDFYWEIDNEVFGDER